MWYLPRTQCKGWRHKCNNQSQMGNPSSSVPNKVPKLCCICLYSSIYLRKGFDPLNVTVLAYSAFLWDDQDSKTVVFCILLHVITYFTSSLIYPLHPGWDIRPPSPNCLSILDDASAKFQLKVQESICIHCVKLPLKTVVWTVHFFL